MSLKFLLTSVLLLLFIVNFRAYWLFRTDRKLTRMRRDRIAESRLLTVALCGGILGAYLGRAHFDHTARKPAFNTRLRRIALAQTAIGGGLALAFLAAT